MYIISHILFDFVFDLFQVVGFRLKRQMSNYLTNDYLPLNSAFRLLT